MCARGGRGATAVPRAGAARPGGGARCAVARLAVPPGRPASVAPVSASRVCGGGAGGAAQTTVSYVLHFSFRELIGQ